VPWIFDFVSGRGVFTTIFGSCLWGLAVCMAVIRSQSRDQRIQKFMGGIEAGALVLWFAYWIYAFFEFPAQNFEGGLSAHRWLVRVHAGLLAAGGALVLIWWLAGLLWLLRDGTLRRSSWERRAGVTSRLPSLEALARMSSLSLSLSFAFWGLGLFLAIINGSLTWRAQLSQSASAVSTMSWILDPKVIITAVLWILLAIAYQLTHINLKQIRGLFTAHLVISTVFLLAFVYLLTGRVSGVHQPVDWFVR
jgi:hypothetical protein